MAENSKTLDDWMWENRYTNKKFAEALRARGVGVSDSTISRIRNKKQNPSPQLAHDIYEFINKEVPLGVLLGVK